MWTPESSMRRSSSRRSQCRDVLAERRVGAVQNGLAQLVVRVAKFLAENERLLVVAASTMIMSLSHTALRPVLPTFAKVHRIHSGTWHRRSPSSLLGSPPDSTSLYREFLAVLSQAGNECITPLHAVRLRYTSRAQSPKP